MGTLFIIDFSWAKWEHAALESDLVPIRQPQMITLEGMLIQIDQAPANQFQDNILYFIAGYIARKVLSRIKCSKCAEQLLSDPDDPKGSQYVLHPQYTECTCHRQKGGLFYASKAVLKVLKATEAAFRRKVVETTQQISFDSKLDLKIQSSVLKELWTSPFDDSMGHFFDHKLGQEADHLSLLLRTVVSTYLQMRLKTYARKYTAEIAHANVQSNGH